MNYKKLAEKYLESMGMLNKYHSHKKINEVLHGEVTVLQYIYRSNAEVVPSKIGDDIGVSSARIATTLNSLEKKGLIIREINPNDRRHILVKLTEKGEKEAQKRYKKIIEHIANVLKLLGEEDAVEYVRILDKLTKLQYNPEPSK